jgi:hypothetical protein
VNSNHKKEVDESEIISQIAEALQRDPKTKGINILVRPHPVNAYIAKVLSGGKIPNVSVYPVNCEFPDTEERRNMFYNSIYHSLAVVGVNTSAFLEASALNKPCITIMTEKFKETQMLPHFHHLTDADFLETANGASELAVIIGQIVNGVDAHSKQRLEFVKNFLRPCGINKPAAEAYADLVEQIANKLNL